MIKEIQDMAVKVLQGEANALEIYTELKKIDKALQDAITSVQADAILEASKHPQKSFEFNGTKIEKKSGAGRWDYSNIKEWNECKLKLKQIEMTAQEAFKICERGGQVADKDGVEIKPAGFISGKDIISVTIPK